MMCADKGSCLSKDCLNMFQLFIYSLLNFSMSFWLWVVKMCSCTHAVSMMWKVTGLSLDWWHFIFYAGLVTSFHCVFWFALWFVSSLYCRSFDVNFTLWIVQFYDMYFCNMHYCYRRAVLRLILLRCLLMFRLSRVLPYGVFFSLFSRLLDY